MIHNEDSTYNPVNAINTLVTSEPQDLTLGIMDEIKKELFKGGVTCETDEEFEEILKLFNEIGILTVQKVGFNIKVSKGPQWI